MIEFICTPEDGERYEVTATSRDVYAWERSGKGRSFSKLMNEMGMGDMYALAHLASRRNQQFTGSLEEFAAAVDLSFDADNEPDPTSPEASASR